VESDSTGSAVDVEVAGSEIEPRESLMVRDEYFDFKNLTVINALDYYITALAVDNIHSTSESRYDIQFKEMCMPMHADKIKHSTINIVAVKKNPLTFEAPLDASSRQTSALPGGRTTICIKAICSTIESMQITKEIAQLLPISSSLTTNV
jgi:hypothetical protein